MIALFIRLLLVLAIPVVVYFVLLNIGVEPMIAMNWLNFLLLAGIGGLFVLIVFGPTREVGPRRQRPWDRVCVPLAYAFVVYQLLNISPDLYPAERVIHAVFYAALFLLLTILWVMQRPERVGRGSVPSWK